MKYACCLMATDPIFRFLLKKPGLALAEISLMLQVISAQNHLRQEHIPWPGRLGQFVSTGQEKK